MRASRVAIAIAALALVAGVLPVSAGTPAPTVGWLDPTFGTRGVAVIPRSTPAADRLALGIVAVSSTGRIYTFAHRGGKPTTTRMAMDLTAFTPGGRLDAAFNGGRTLAVHTYPDGGECCSVQGVFPTLDGGAEVVFSHWETYVYARRYSTAGARTWRVGDPPLALGTTALTGGSIRYLWADINEAIWHETPLSLRGWTPDGKVDTRIGPGGRRAVGLLSGYAGITRDSQNRLYLVGRPLTDPPSEDAMEIQRRTLHGDLDPTYGTGGRTTIVLPSSDAMPTAAGDAHGPPAVVLGPDRSLFLAGRRTDAGTGRVSVLIRKITPGGFVDTAFGDSGVLSIPATVGSSRFGAFIVDGSGRIIVSYVDRTAAGLQPMLARYDGATGELDPGYGNGGRIAVGNLVTEMALTADGDLLTVSRGVRSGSMVLYLARRSN